MKRRFALPASIALALHASLFLGSSDPRIGPVVPVKPPQVKEEKPRQEDPPRQEIELTSNSVSQPGGLTSDEPAGNEHLLKPPPGIPDPKLPPDLGPNIITQTKVTFTGGDGTRPGSWMPRGPGKGDGDKPMGVSELDRAPHTRYQKSPSYPRSMRISGNSGTVWVDFLVDERGRVSNVRVLKSTHRDFEEATVAAVSEWRFEPGTHKGLPVRFRMSVPVVFSLND